MKEKGNSCACLHTILYYRKYPEETGLFQSQLALGRQGTFYETGDSKSYKKRGISMIFLKSRFTMKCWYHSIPCEKKDLKSEEQRTPSKRHPDYLTLPRITFLSQGLDSRQLFSRQSRPIHLLRCPLARPAHPPRLPWSPTVTSRHHMIPQPGP